MQLNQRIISQMPLSEIWNEHRIVSTKMIRSLSADDITNMLRVGEVSFVVANIGDKPKWIPLEECFEFWKSEVKMRVANPEAEGFYLENFPEEYCYIAEEWEAEENKPLILLKMSH